MAWLVAGHGVPALRHDWSFPTTRLQAQNELIDFLNGWSPAGIGRSEPTLNGSLIGTMIALLAFLAGPLSAILIVTGGIGASLALTGFSLAGTFRGRSVVGGVAVALVLAFNPWVYNEAVAGHVFALISYCCLCGLLRCAILKSRNSLVVSLLILGTAAQLQLFLAAVPLIVYLATALRSPLVVISFFVARLPTIAGLVLYEPSLVRTPYSEAWEISQAIPGVAVFTMLGYSPHYDRVFLVALPAIALLIVAAIIGAIQRFKERPIVVAAIVAEIALIFVFVSRWRDPYGHQYAVSVSAMSVWPALRAFRELYDLIAFLAIAYALFLAAVVKEYPRWNRALAAVMLLLPIAWFLAPPWRYFVPARDVPTSSIPQAPGRLAFLPAFQPISRAGRGSGVDPAWFAAPSPVLNEYLPTYPVDVALALAQYRGDYHALAALGVTSVIDRRPLGLDTDENALQRQQALPLPRAGASSTQPQLTICNAIPRVSMSSLPPVRTAVPRLGSGELFFGDVAGLSGPGVPSDWRGWRRVVPIFAKSSAIDPKAGWVDARLAFIADPDLGQPFGGVLTTSTVIFRLDPTDATLAYVRGALLDGSGHMLRRSTAGYEWLPRGVAQARCAGLCVLAAQGVPPVLAPPATKADRRIDVPSDAPLPWLRSFTLPAGPPTVLRLNDRYTTRWTYFGPGGSPAHVRIEGAVNGWLLPERTSRGSVVLCELGAGVESVLALLGFAWFFCLLTALIRRPLVRLHLRIRLPQSGETGAKS